jgi:hypothetical protein
LNCNCYILCAAGYAETSTQQAKLWLEREGIEPIFLGLKAGSISGAAGGTVAAEALISFFIGAEAKRPLPHGLLLAGGAACSRQFLTDPRVHLLIQQMRQAAKPVGFLHPVSYPLVFLMKQQVGEHTFRLQEDQPINEFMNAFASQLFQAGTATPTRSTTSHN